MPYSHREDFPSNPRDKAHFYQPFSLEEWHQSNFARKDELQWFEDARYGMFIHFGLSTKENKDLSWEVCYTRKAPDIGHGPYADEEWTQWPNNFYLEKFDAKKWVNLAKICGFKYIVLIAKHHDGFHLWDTDESEFKITNTPFGRDMVKEVVEASHEIGMPIGLYYSQRDWYHPDYIPVDPHKVEKQERVQWTLLQGFDSPVGARHHLYLEYQERVIRELCTRYGKIDIFWWDAAWWGGMFTADMWDAERITRLIREWQPGILLNNRCSVPGDFDTPEQRIGAFQNWRPWESCVCLTETWSYSGTPAKTMKDLVNMLTATICGDGNLLMSWGPHWNGEFDEVEVKRLEEFGAWINQHERAIYGTRGGPWKPGPWGGSVYRGSTVYLHITHLVGEFFNVPELPECNVLSAKLYNTGRWVTVETRAGIIRLHIPLEIQDDLDTVIELELDTLAVEFHPVDSCGSSPFSDVYAYGYEYNGKILLRSCSLADTEINPEVQLPLRTRGEHNPWVIFDLCTEINLTGVVLSLGDSSGSNANLHLYTSTDLEEWIDCGNVERTLNEIEISSYKAGAWIPGRNVRYVKVQSVSCEPTNIDVLNFVGFAR